MGIFQCLDQADRTSTALLDLKDEARVLELASMLGEVSDGTLQSATELLAAVQENTKVN